MHPDEILAQIQQLADQFVSAGGDPQQLMDAVQGGGAPPDPNADPDAQGDAGGGDPGADPSQLLAGMGAGGGQDQMPMMSGDTPVPDMSGMAPDGGVPAGSSLADASAMAQQDMKKRMKR